MFHLLLHAFNMVCCKYGQRCWCDTLCNPISRVNLTVLPSNFPCVLGHSCPSPLHGWHSRFEVFVEKRNTLFRLILRFVVFALLNGRDLFKFYIQGGIFIDLSQSLLIFDLLIERRHIAYVSLNEVIPFGRVISSLRFLYSALNHWFLGGYGCSLGDFEGF